MGWIQTKNGVGAVNGYLLPIFNKLEQRESVDQVYITTVFEGMSKGPHLHHIRTGRFLCIRGRVDLILRFPDGHYVYYEMDAIEPKVYEVPTGYAAELRNSGDGTAWVLNMPSPAWDKDNQDDNSVVDWKPPYASYRHWHRELRQSAEVAEDS